MNPQPQEGDGPPATESPAGETRPAETPEATILVLRACLAQRTAEADLAVTCAKAFQAEVTALRSALVAETDARKRVERERDRYRVNASEVSIQRDTLVSAKVGREYTTHDFRLLEERIDTLKAQNDYALADASALRAALEQIAAHPVEAKAAHVQDGISAQGIARAALASPHPDDRLRDVLAELCNAADDRLTRAARSVGDSLQQRRRLEEAVVSAKSALAPFRREQGQAAADKAP